MPSPGCHPAAILAKPRGGVRREAWRGDERQPAPNWWASQYSACLSFEDFVIALRHRTSSSRASRTRSPTDSGIIVARQELRGQPMAPIENVLLTAAPLIATPSAVSAIMGPCARAFEAAGRSRTAEQEEGPAPAVVRGA